MDKLKAIKGNFERADQAFEETKNMSRKSDRGSSLGPESEGFNTGS